MDQQTWKQKHTFDRDHKYQINLVYLLQIRYNMFDCLASYEAKSIMLGSAS